MRGILVAALELVFSRPGRWAVAAAGFLARGGLFLFVAILVELPSPITVTLMFGIDSVTGAGRPTDRLVTTIAILAVAAFVAVLAATLVAAWTDVVSFDRGAEDEPGAAAPSRALHGGARLRGVLGLSWLQSLGLLPGVAAVVLAAPAVRDAVIGEFLLPSAPEIPFVVRVLEVAQGPLIRAVAVLAVCELVVTVATRIFLKTPGGGSIVAAYRGSLSWIVRRPHVAAATWAAGWLVLLGAAAAALWAVALAWERVRAVLLDPGFTLPFLPGACPGPNDCPETGVFLPTIATAVGATALFVTVWVAAIVLVGVASALRSSLWTLTLAGRDAGRPGEQTVVGWRADAHA